MASPFPGMDPYLEDEAIWPTFQHHLVNCLHQLLLPGLVDRYKARIGQRRYVTQQALFTSVVTEEHVEEYIEIRHRGESKTVTLVDVVSPCNKTTTPGRLAYLAKRQECKVAGASLVELDLVLQGQATLDYSREGLPDWDYAVTVTRNTQPDRYEIYTATLQKRLPRFRLPLSNDDRDAVVDLHAAFARAYDQGGFAAILDYSRDPTTSFNSEDKQWLDELLQQKKLR